MKVEIRELEELVREVSIEIEPAEVNKKLESKFSEVQRDVTLKGFRKGHAPLNIIKSQFADEVKADVADELIKATISEALRERALPVATPPTVTDLNYTDNGGFNYTARVEVFPTIPPIAFDNLKVSFYDLTVTDEEVDRAAEQVRKAYAERRTVTRAVGEGDIVVVDLVQTFDSPKEEPEKAYPDSVIELSNPLTVKEFREQLPGLTAGDTREIEVHYAADYPDEEFAGATVRYRTTVKEVREEIQPAFDDYLAKRTGHAQTALELRMKIREDLKAQKERELRRYHRNEIVQQVIERNKVSVPAGL
ncbi:MAG TPA: trigger factor, partial [candidate division Zixibacteria bacterium]|nr:trigger factor [candidate division Zixibacteria bacterium]